MKCCWRWGRILDVVLLSGLGFLAAACGASRSQRPAAGGATDAAREYEKAVLAHGASLLGGIAAVSRPDGDSVFVVTAAGLQEYDGTTGALRRTLQGSDDRPTLASVRNVAADGSRLILVASVDDRVQVLDMVHETLLADHAGFARPIDAALLRNDLLVTEQRSGSIALQRPDALRAETYVTGMRSPAGLAATDTALWATDSASGTILQLVANGERLAEPIEIAAGLARPEGLGVTPSGWLVVVEAGAQRLTRVDARTRTRQVIDQHLPVGGASDNGRAPIGHFNGVAVGRCGTLYVAADLTGEILRYTPKGAACE